MGNCLVTQLKESVNNANLRKIGEAIFKIKGATNPDDYQLGINLTSPNGFHMECDSPNYFTVTNPSAEHKTSYDFPAGLNVVYFKNADFNVRITSKYDAFSKIEYKGSGYNARLVSVDLADFKYSQINNLALGYGTYNTGSIDDISSLELSSLKLIGGNYTGNINNLPRTITYLLLNTVDNIDGGESYIPSNNITYLTCCLRLSTINLANLSNCASLQTLNLDNSMAFGNISSLNGLNSLSTVTMKNTNVTGTLDSLELLNCESLNVLGTNLSMGTVEGVVATLIRIGRDIKTKPFAISGLLEFCTFGGQEHPWNYDKCFVDYDSASKITVYQTSTTIANAYKIYAKNATAEEIAAWENAGKTVVVVE